MPPRASSKTWPRGRSCSSSTSEDYRLFQRYLRQHHYLGHRGPVGENLAYLIRTRVGVDLACVLLRAGRRANPRTPQQRASKRLKQSKAQNLLDRLEGYEDGILAFLRELDLPFTNNEAERALRMMKVRIKISGCFRTLAGARRHVRIRSYISTLRKHRLPVLQHLRRALDGRPFLPQAAKST